MEDIPFILELRTDTFLTRFIHPTPNDYDKQVEWMKEYKKREQEGKDYYFIYTKDGVPFGMNRVYGIEGNHGTAGSWICRPGTTPELSIAILLMLRDIMFGVLELEEDWLDVRKNNKKVQRIHLLSGAVKTGETDLDILYLLKKEDYLRERENIIKLLNLKDGTE